MNLVADENIDRDIVEQLRSEGHRLFYLPTLKALYLAWQGPDSRRWHSVGRLSHDQEGYRFTYTHGALTSPRFGYLGRMRDTAKIYRSQELFPLFANRLLDESRPEYPDYLRWMSVDGSADKLELLARSGGRRGTDQLCVYPEVEPNNCGEMEIHFFSHGLRYLSADEQTAITRLRPGDTLQLAEDDNPHYRGPHFPDSSLNYAL